jgi:hypothetical protein
MDVNAVTQMTFGTGAQAEECRLAMGFFPKKKP